MGIFFSSFSSDKKTWIRDDVLYQLGEIDDNYYSIEIKINTDLHRLLRLPIVWNIFCHLIPHFKLDVEDLNYILVNKDVRDKITIRFPNETTLYISLGNGYIRLKDTETFVETLQKSINIAVKYISEKRDLNALSLSSKDFIDIDPKPIRSPLQFFDLEVNRETNADALNVFAHYYYPEVMKNMGKEIGVPIELDLDKNHERCNGSQIRKMNLLFKDQIRKSKIYKLKNK